MQTFPNTTDVQTFGDDHTGNKVGCKLAAWSSVWDIGQKTCEPRSVSSNWKNGIYYKCGLPGTALLNDKIMRNKLVFYSALLTTQANDYTDRTVFARATQSFCWTCVRILHLCTLQVCKYLETRARRIQHSWDSFMSSNHLPKPHAWPAGKLCPYGGLQCLLFSTVCTTENAQKHCLIWYGQGPLGATLLCPALSPLVPFACKLHTNAISGWLPPLKKKQGMTFHWPWGCGRRMGAIGLSFLQRSQLR